MESDGGTAHQNAEGVAWYGIDAGVRAKSKCRVADHGTTGDTYVNDMQANWYYISTTLGTDDYGFRALPAGSRYHPSGFNGRGTSSYFWTSSASDASRAWYRVINYTLANIARNNAPRSDGFPVRCIRN
jgi:uncharacterized protein (TIGR02145 family)